MRVAAPVNQLPQIFLPNPNVVALAAQQARIAELEMRVSEGPRHRGGGGTGAGCHERARPAGAERAHARPVAGGRG